MTIKSYIKDKDIISYYDVGNVYYKLTFSMNTYHKVKAEKEQSYIQCGMLTDELINTVSLNQTAITEMDFIIKARDAKLNIGM